MPLHAACFRSETLNNIIYSLWSVAGQLFPRPSDGNKELPPVQLSATITVTLQFPMSTTRCVGVTPFNLTNLLVIQFKYPLPDLLTDEGALIYKHCGIFLMCNGRSEWDLLSFLPVGCCPSASCPSQLHNTASLAVPAAHGEQCHHRSNQFYSCHTEAGRRFSWAPVTRRFFLAWIKILMPPDTYENLPKRYQYKHRTEPRRGT